MSKFEIKGVAIALALLVAGSAGAQAAAVQGAAQAPLLAAAGTASQVTAVKKEVVVKKKTVVQKKVVQKKVVVKKPVVVQKKVVVKKPVVVKKTVVVHKAPRVVVVRPWYTRPYYGSLVAGVALGTVIAVTAAGAVPYAPREDLCWYWTSPAKINGYWDYCN